MIDCDDKKISTWPAVQNFLWGLGLEPGSYPAVSTPNHGKHAYLTLEGSIPGNYRLIRQETGAGEFRYGSGAYIAAPPSVLPNGTYQLEQGDFLYMPVLRAADILPLLSRNVKHSAGQDEGGSRTLSRGALALLQGKGLEKYQTHSEAEQAILTTLANAGFAFSEVLPLFLKYPAGGKFKILYQKNPKTAVQWLERSFQKALEFIQANETPARKQVREMLIGAQNSAWPGRTGSTNRAVYLAHATIAYRAARTVYAASSRTLAEMAGVSRPTAEQANRRLLQAGLIQLEDKACAEQANKYRLLEHPFTTSSIDCEEVDKECTTAQDVFRYSGLGKAAGEMYSLLQKEELTCGELAERTGRHLSTIKRNLIKMNQIIDSRTGEIISMLERDGEKWRAVSVNLDDIAVLVGTAGTGEKQRKKHAQERLQHKRGVSMGKYALLDKQSVSNANTFKR